jgi:glutamyl-tRNA synthetase
MEEVRVRFAPSPTGYLHIGGARTALFNWLFARHERGKFFLRIEDTDRSRSTEEAIHAIIDGMRWLGLDWDKWEAWPTDPVRQTERMEIYGKRVEELLSKGLAYRCYCSPEELEARRREAMAQGRIPRYDGRCRARSEPVPGRTPAIRFKAVAEGETVVDDLIKGTVVFENSHVDDLIIRRSDGTPTYNFCVVVDDVDMAITHVIRGDDHLNNTPRQIQLYRAFGFQLPRFGHLSMILGSDKARLSKRHGATSVQSYRDEGYLPEAMVNYLVRLGWSRGDQEIFSREEMVRGFSLQNITKSPAVFNPEKLLWLNAHYIKNGDPQRLADLLVPHLERLGVDPNQLEKTRLERVVVALRERARTLKEMAESALYFFSEGIEPDEKARRILSPEAIPVLEKIHRKLSGMPFDPAGLEAAVREITEETGLKMSAVAQPVRAAITGRTVSPGIFDVLMILGKEKSLRRIEAQIRRLKNDKGGAGGRGPEAGEKI